MNRFYFHILTAMAHVKPGQRPIAALVVVWLLIAFLPIATADEALRTDRADAPRSTASPRPDEDLRWAKRFAKALHGKNTEARQKTFDRIQDKFSYHPEAVRIVADAVEDDLRNQQVDYLSREMIRFLAASGSQFAKDRLLSWFNEFAGDHEPTTAGIELTYALRKFDAPETHGAIVPLLDKEDYRLAMLAIDVLSLQRHSESFAKIRDMELRPEFSDLYGFRACVLDGIHRYENSESVDFLIGRLPAMEGQLKYRVIHGLSRTTGKQFGDDVPAWAHWWNEEGKSKFQTPQQAYKVQLPIRWLADGPRYFGDYVYANRGVFVIDRSSSMGQMSRYRVSKLDLAKRELIGAIAGLRSRPPSDEFNIVFFDRNVAAWSSMVLPATPQNKMLAADFTMKLTTGLGTNISGAMDATFASDRNLEVIYLVSDGQPTVGVIGPLVQYITDLNLFRRITINTICIGGHNPLMEAIAQRNGGTYRVVR